MALPAEELADRVIPTAFLANPPLVSAEVPVRLAAVPGPAGRQELELWAPVRVLSARGNSLLEMGADTALARVGPTSVQARVLAYGAARAGVAQEAVTVPRPRLVKAMWGLAVLQVLKTSRA